MNNGNICVSVCATTPGEMASKIASAEEYADIIELRLDCLSPELLRDLLTSLPDSRRRYLYTLRTKSQGGKREISESDRTELANSLSAHAAEGYLVDTEFEPANSQTVDDDSRRVISWHELAGNPGARTQGREMLRRFPNSTIKVAAAVDDITDSLEVWKLLNDAKKSGAKVVPIAMGDAGKWTRILGLAHGAAMTFASLDDGVETAAGQISARELTEVYRAKELSLETKVYGVIGSPLTNSKSVYIHNAAFAASGTDAVFIPLEVGDLAAFMERMVLEKTREVDLNFAGFAVTMPHKQAIIQYLDHIDSVAARVGAVNTVKIENGRLSGYNTDVDGFIVPLTEKLGSIMGMRAAVFGAGGAARACIYALLKEGCEVFIYSRDPDKAATVGKEFGIDSSPVSAFSSANSTMAPARPFDILVNATPLGMKGPYENEPVLTADAMAGARLVYDLVTSFGETPTIREARLAGVPWIAGAEMLIAQGARQFSIWTGTAAPIRVMRQALNSQLK